MTAALSSLLVCLMFLSSAQAHTVQGSLHAVTLNSWNTEWWLTALFALSALLYAVGYWRYARSGARSTLRQWRAAAWWVGWSACVLSILSPLDALGGQLFSAHMVQHELLMLVAAPLMVLGRPWSMFAWAIPRSWSMLFAANLRKRTWRRVWRLLTIPLVAWLLHALVLWIWHAPAFFERSLSNAAVHDLQHAMFFFSAVLFWWSLIGRRVRADSVLYVLTTMLHTGALGMLLTFAALPWYPTYLTTTQVWGLTPLEDQQLGGLIMWVPSGIVLLVAALALTNQWLNAHTARPQAIPPSPGHEG